MGNSRATAFSPVSSAQNSGSVRSTSLTPHINLIDTGHGGLIAIAVAAQPWRTRPEQKVLLDVAYDIKGILALGGVQPAENGI
jgi:hypothetical protein